MTLERLPPSSYVELDDLMAGGRKLAIVDASGVGYFDVIADNELPKPLHTNLHPMPLGTITSWLATLDDGFSDQVLDLWDRLTTKGRDVLTIGRALRWAITNGNADLEQAERAAEEATGAILRGRNVVERQITA